MLKWCIKNWSIVKLYNKVLIIIKSTFFFYFFKKKAFLKIELFFQILALCVSFAIKIGSKQTDPIQIHGMFSNEKNIDPRFLRHKSPPGIKEWRDIYNLFYGAYMDGRRLVADAI